MLMTTLCQNVTIYICALQKQLDWYNFHGDSRVKQLCKLRYAQTHQLQTHVDRVLLRPTFSTCTSRKQLFTVTVNFCTQTVPSSSMQTVIFFAKIKIKCKRLSNRPSTPERQGRLLSRASNTRVKTYIFGLVVGNPLLRPEQSRQSMQPRSHPIRPSQTNNLSTTHNTRSARGGFRPNRSDPYVVSRTLRCLIR